jgi:hypothetical protein
MFFLRVTQEKFQRKVVQYNVDNDEKAKKSKKMKKQKV